MKDRGPLLYPAVFFGVGGGGGELLIKNNCVKLVPTARSLMSGFSFTSH